MRQGIINYSSLARQIRPEIEEASGERVSVEAITLALNRQARRMTSSDGIDFSSYLGEISVQSGLGILTIPQADINTDAFFGQQESFTNSTNIWCIPEEFGTRHS